MSHVKYQGIEWETLGQCGHRRSDPVDHPSMAGQVVVWCLECLMCPVCHNTWCLECSICLCVTTPDVWSVLCVYVSQHLMFGVYYVSMFHNTWCLECIMCLCVTTPDVRSESLMFGVSYVSMCHWCLESLKFGVSYVSNVSWNQDIFGHVSTFLESHGISKMPRVCHGISKMPRSCKNENTKCWSGTICFVTKTKTKYPQESRAVSDHKILRLRALTHAQMWDSQNSRTGKSLGFRCVRFCFLRILAKNDRRVSSYYTVNERC